MPAILKCSMESLVALLLGILILLFLKHQRKNYVEGSIARDSLTNKNHGHGYRCFSSGLSSAEYYLANYLAQELDKRNYYIFNNIIIPSSVCGSNQIDHLVVSRYGIFVIENKNYSGWIFAHRDHKEWTQTQRSGRKFHFPNPILQNYAQVNALKEYMPYAAKYIHGVVVFTRTCEFRTPKPENVLFDDEIVEHISSYTKEVMKPVEYFVTIGHLSHTCQTDEISFQQHKQNISEYLETKAKKVHIS